MTLTAKMGTHCFENHNFALKSKTTKFTKRILNYNFLLFCKFALLLIKII